MIKQEKIGNLIRTYSDEDYYIIQVETGDIYEDALDIPNVFTYKESENKIERVYNEVKEEETNDDE